MLVGGGIAPPSLQRDRFVATPLTAETAALDYAAYMSSPDVIRTHSDGRWPVDGFTLADDLELVAKHEADHVAGRAFTFVLLAPTRDEALGCLYLNPLRSYLAHVAADRPTLDAFPAASAMVTFWLRQDQQESDLADAVVEAVNDWVLRDWPLEAHAFRVLPAEQSSCRALDRSSLTQVSLVLPGESRPYAWYVPA